jgi:uncharacterized protein (TIGR02466 family)
VRYPAHIELNRALAERILDMRESSSGIRQSNVGGWHSEGDFLRQLGEPWAGTLARLFLDGVRGAVASVAEMAEQPGQAAIEAWANVNEAGDSNAPHIHPGSVWSGVYFVAAKADSGGILSLTDPRSAALMVAHQLNPFPSTNNVQIHPQPGLLVVFPSFVYHAVSVYHGDSSRISIAFNLR